MNEGSPSKVGSQVNASLPIKTLIPAAALLGLSVVREMSLWGSFAIGIASLVFLSGGKTWSS